jgi:hypothetical protein
VPTTNNTFTIVTFGAHSSLFTGLDLPSTALWATNYTATTFSVTVASSNKLVFATQPVGVLTNIVLAPVVVQIETPTGVPFPTNGVPITLSLASGSGPILGTLTQNTDASGKATFADLRFNLYGYKTLKASTGPATPVNSVSFRILPLQEALWTTNGFQLTLNGTNSLGSTIIYATRDLTLAFAPIYTNPATSGPIVFVDSKATNFPVRFYQAVEQ